MWAVPGSRLTPSAGQLALGPESENQGLLSGTTPWEGSPGPQHHRGAGITSKARGLALGRGWGGGRKGTRREKPQCPLRRAPRSPPPPSRVTPQEHRLHGCLCEGACSLRGKRSVALLRSQCPSLGIFRPEGKVSICCPLPLLVGGGPRGTTPPLQVQGAHRVLQASSAGSHRGTGYRAAGLQGWSPCPRLKLTWVVEKRGGLRAARDLALPPSCRPTCP